MSYIISLYSGDRFCLSSEINNLYLSFNEHFNIICGANGVGKSTVLNCINDAFI